MKMEAYISKKAVKVALDAIKAFRAEKKIRKVEPGDLSPVGGYLRIDRSGSSQTLTLVTEYFAAQVAYAFDGVELLYMEGEGKTKGDATIYLDFAALYDMHKNGTDVGFYRVSTSGDGVLQEYDVWTGVGCIVLHVRRASHWLEEDSDRLLEGGLGSVLARARDAFVEEATIYKIPPHNADFALHVHRFLSLCHDKHYSGAVMRAAASVIDQISFRVVPSLGEGVGLLMPVKV